MSKEQVQYKNYDLVEYKQDEDKREFTAIISTSDVDLVNEVLLPDGANIKSFKNNPMVLLNHDRNLPIGRAPNIRRQGNGLVAKGFIGKNIERINDTWELVKQGIISGVSVGFIEVDSRTPSFEDKKMFGKNVQRVITRWILKEFSFVVFPCNEAAMITACKSLSITPEELGIETKETKALEQENKETEQEILVKQVKEQMIKDNEQREVIDSIKEELIKKELFKNGIIVY